MDYSKVISSKARNIEPSGIRKFFDLLGGRADVVALTVGQPDFKTPWHIREAGIDSLTKGKTYYTANSGMMELRREISSYLDRRFDLKYNPDNEIIVTVGGSEAIDIAVRALVDTGDEVIIPTPSFVCYEPIVSLAGGVPVIMETKRENDFKINPERLKSLVTPKTKLLILPFPNNPTGAVLDKKNLEDIAQVLRDTNVMILSDEIYAELTYDERHVSIASVDGMKERTIIASGFSKSYAMTGWRMGYCVAPAPITEQMYKIHQYAIMCAPTASQYASVEALRNGDEDIEMMKREYNRRRKYIISGLRNIGIDCFEAKGAFYVFPKIGDFGMSSDEFCTRLLDENGVAIVPGTAFGKCGEGFARISYAYSVNHIAEALERIELFIKDKR